jgi:4-hydroxybenzoate polyprenyltransferase
MAFAAQTGQVPVLAGGLFIINLLWIVAYDTLYAMTDRADDLKIGVKSTAILFGQADKIIVAGLQISVVLALFSLVFIIPALGPIYLLALCATAGTFLYQQWLIKDREPSRCFQAFLNNHWSGLIIFLGLLIDYWF